MDKKSKSRFPMAKALIDAEMTDMVEVDVTIGEMADIEEAEALAEEEIMADLEIEGVEDLVADVIVQEIAIEATTAEMTVAMIIEKWFDCWRKNYKFQQLKYSSLILLYVIKSH